LSRSAASDKIAGMKRALRVLLAAAVLVGTFSCGGRTPDRNLPGTWVWTKDQSAIEPTSGRMNVWGGFEVREGFFSAEKNTASFILWRRAEGEVRLSIEYILRGKPCHFRVNGTAVGELAPSTHPVSVEFASRLNTGGNFLEFVKMTNDVLRVSSVRIGPKEDRSHRHLELGESLTVGTGGSRGRLVFSGRGTLAITEVAFHEGRESKRTFERKVRWPGRRSVYEFEGTSPGYVTFTAGSGGFDVVEREAAPVPGVPAADTPRFAGLPDIFIFLIDACRPDHLGLYGYPRPTSPHLDRFAVDAVVFENAYANASFTRSSVATLFTGLYPESHKVRILMGKLSERLLTIPVFLKGKGYRTSLFTATANVSKNTGFARGVDDYFPNIGEWRRGKERDMPDQFARWVGREGPLFGYVHFMEPHLPISPPPPFRDLFSDPKDRTFVRTTIEEFNRKINADSPFSPEEVRAVVDNYDAAITYIDGEVGKLIRSLKDKGSYDDSLIIVLSDHGESLYERAYWGHGSKVYEETTHVPLLVKFPASMGLKGRVAGVVELAGAFPTLIDLFGQAVGLNGTSWLPAVSAGGMNEAMSVSRAFSNHGDFGLRWRGWYAVINLLSGAETLYCSARPVFKEAGTGEESVRLLFKVRFLEWLARFAELDDQPVAIDLRSHPTNELENLRSLGYIK
jgi:arylsulfatase A-like enzyme